MEEELWRPVCNYENYEVSNLGRIRNKKFDRIIKPFNHCNGYDLVDLANKGVGKTHTVHRIVANAWIPNTENKPQIDHWDNNKKNNAVSNLSWVTALENIVRTPRVQNARRRNAWIEESRRFLAISI